MWGDWAFTAPGGRTHVVKNGPTWHEARALASVALGVPTDVLTCVNTPVDKVERDGPVDVWRAFKPKPKPKSTHTEAVAPCGCVCHLESPRGKNGPLTSVVKMCKRHKRRERK